MKNKKNEENYIYIKLTDKNYYSYNYIKKKKNPKKEEKGEKKVGKRVSRTINKLSNENR